MRRIHEMAEGDRPREKLQQKGAQALSDLELLAVLLGSGNRHMDVLTLAGKVLQLLDRTGSVADMNALLAVPGMGRAKAALIVAGLEFARRRIRPHGLKIGIPSDAYPLIRHLADRHREQFIAISLNGANEVIAVRTVTVGLVNRALVHPREVFADPITDRATALIVAHNHPSGNLDPSQDDLLVTKQLKAAGETLGIRLLDHIIFNHENHYSMMAQGQL